MVTLFLSLIVAGILTFNFVIIKGAAQTFAENTGMGKDVLSDWMTGFLLGIVPNLIGYVLVILHLRGTL